MKLAITVGSLYRDFDGVSRVAHRYMDLLKARGVEMVAFSQAVPPEGGGEIRMVKVPSFPFPLYTKYRVAVFAPHILREELHDFIPDIIHVHSPDLLGFHAAEYGRRNKIPVVATHHTRFQAYLQYYNLSFLEGTLWNWTKKIYARCETVLCPSSEIVTELNEHGIKNAELLPHGVDTKLFGVSHQNPRFKERLGIKDKTVLLFASRLVWEKDLKVLAEAYHLLGDRKDIAFVVAGDGPARKELEKLMPTALFLGQQKAGDLAETYASSDIFVFPSTTETFGLVALEAMSSGLPVVAAHATGLTDIVRDGENGFLTEACNAQDFAAKIRILLDNPDLRKKMATSAVSYALTQSWDEIVDRLLVCYDRYVRRGPEGG